MIKVIAFDLVGVLVTEREINLTKEEDRLERMFGNNINDSDYLIEARKIIEKDSILMRTTEELINKLYKVKDELLFKKIKEKYNNGASIDIRTQNFTQDDIIYISCERSCVLWERQIRSMTKIIKKILLSL